MNNQNIYYYTSAKLQLTMKNKQKTKIADRKLTED